jgi:hypothetical protein
MENKIEELNGVSCLTNAGMMSLILQDSIRDLVINTASSESSKVLTASILRLSTFIHSLQLLLRPSVHIIIPSSDNVLLNPKEDIMQFSWSLGKWLVPEPVLLILHEFDKADQQSEWVRSLYNDAFKEDSADPIGDTVGLLGSACGDEEEEHEGDVEVGVGRGVSKLISYHR